MPTNRKCRREDQRGVAWGQRRHRTHDNLPKQTPSLGTYRYFGVRSTPPAWPCGLRRRRYGEPRRSAVSVCCTIASAPSARFSFGSLVRMQCCDSISFIGDPDCDDGASFVWLRACESSGLYLVQPLNPWDARISFSLYM